MNPNLRKEILDYLGIEDLTGVFIVDTDNECFAVVACNSGSNRGVHYVGANGWINPRGESSKGVSVPLTKQQLDILSGYLNQGDE